MPLRRGISNSKRLGLNPDNAVYAGVRDLLHRLGHDAENHGSEIWKPWSLALLSKYTGMDGVFP